MSEEKTRAGQPPCPECMSINKVYTQYENPGTPENKFTPSGNMVNYCARCKIQYPRE